MNFTVEDHNMGDSFIVRFEDDTYALVDILYGEIYRDDPDVLMSQGYWVEVEENPITEEQLERITEVIKKAAQ